METLEERITESARLLARYYARRGLTDRIARWDRHITREGANLWRLESMRAGER